MLFDLVETIGEYDLRFIEVIKILEKNIIYVIELCDSEKL